MMSNLEQLKIEISSARADCYGAVAKYLLDHSGTAAEANQAVAEIAETTANYSDVLDRLIRCLETTEVDGRVGTKDAIQNTVAKAIDMKRALQRLQLRAAKRMK